MVKISAQGRSKIMRAVKSKNSSIEIRFRKALFAVGYRYRLHYKSLPGSPDIVFPGRKKVIFIHGCFWHQHENCLRSKIPTVNTEYWIPKLKRNVQRDRENEQQLLKLGWQVHTVWECAFKDFQDVITGAINFLEG